MSIVDKIQDAAIAALQELYGVDLTKGSVSISATKPEFEGDYTIVLFAFIKSLKKQPEILGKELGDHLLGKHADIFASYNVIKGFLNLAVTDDYWIHFLQEQYDNSEFGLQKSNGKKVMVEYSSPNTNKPLHLGHLRNNFLGWSAAALLEACGNEMVKTCIVNDRGIHICKSMIAWQLFGNGETPASTAKKGDHFVGDYYVKFNDEYKKQVSELVIGGIMQTEAEKQAPIMLQAQQMLIDWEAGDAETVALWKKMNQWVYDGFDITYKRIGTDFDRIYYESDTYLLGKKMVTLGLEKGVFIQKEDGSVWIDLTAEGLDEKIVQRRDGTSVYITQDIGLAIDKYEEYHCGQSIYVVGDEQNYHFKVLKHICQKLQLPSADGIFHLSYGMVELPTGKMKSREGTVVDADDMIDEMVNIARQKTEELGKVKDFNAGEFDELCNMIGLGALKFFLLRVDPKKRMIFNPDESIDFHGFTGPFIQYTHARIKSVLRKAGIVHSAQLSAAALLPLEKELIKQIETFPAAIEEAATEHDPSKLAIYIYNLAKIFNGFYAEHSIANAETETKKALRLAIAVLCAHTIKKAMQLLGIQVPERM